MSPPNEAPPAHPKLLSSGAMMLVATAFASAAHFLFQMIMSRMLGKDEFGEFGVMNTMLGIFGIFALPATALQLAIARHTAMLDAKGESDSIAAMLQRAARRLGMICTLLALALFALSPWLKSYLKLDRYGPIFVTLAMVVSVVVLPVGTGALQGLKRFGWLSVVTGLTPLARIALGVFLVWYGWKATGALFGTLAGNLVALVLCAGLLGSFFRRKVSLDQIDTSEVYRYLGPTFICLIAYAGMVNLDMVIVKHYFSPEQAAQYSAANRFGQAIGWVISPLCTVLFPHVWDQSRHEANRALLLKFLLAAVGLGVAAACACTIGRGLLTSLLLGRADAAVTNLIPLCVWAMLPIGVANVFLNFVMARGRYGFLAVFVAIVVLYLAAFALWHDTLPQVLAVVALFGVVTLAMFVAITYRTDAPEGKP